MHEMGRYHHAILRLREAVSPPAAAEREAALAAGAAKNRQLWEVLSEACRGFSITPDEAWSDLTESDIEDWRIGRLTTDELGAYVRALAERREMNAGRRPAHYTHRAVCAHCGPIWYWVSGEVPGCTWCMNRVFGWPIPRPGGDKPAQGRADDSPRDPVDRLARDLPLNREDVRYLKRRIRGRHDRKKLLAGYRRQWIEAAESEHVEHRREAAGRRAANAWLLSQTR